MHKPIHQQCSCVHSVYGSNLPSMNSKDISVKQIITVVRCSIFLFHIVSFQYSSCCSSTRIIARFLKILRFEELVHRSLHLEEVLKTQGQNQKATGLQVVEIMKSAISSEKEVSRKNWRSDIFSSATIEYLVKENYWLSRYNLLPLQQYTLNPVKSLPSRLRSHMTAVACINPAFNHP